MKNNLQKYIRSNILNLRKLIALFLIASGLIAYNFNYTQRTYAALPTFDFTNWVANYGNLFNSSSQLSIKLAEIAEKITVEAAKTALIKEVEKKTLAWINGGFDGSPLFLQNPESFFKNITIDQLSIVKKSAIGDLQNASNVMTSELRAANKDITRSLIDEVVNKKANFQDSLLPTYNTDICKKLTADIKMYTEMSSSTDITDAEKKGWKDNANLSKEKYKQNCNANTKEKKAEQIANNKECISSFSCSGWGGILAITQNPAQNTDAGRAAAIKNNFEENKAAAEKKANDQLDRGNGYMDKTKCREKEIVDGRGICVSSETLTPGQSALTVMDQNIRTPIQRTLGSTDLTSLVSNLTSAAIYKVMDMGIEKATEAIEKLASEVDKNINSLTDELGVELKQGTTVKVNGTTSKPVFPIEDTNGNIELTEGQMEEMLSLLKPFISQSLDFNKKEVESLDRLMSIYRQVFNAYTQIASCYDGKKMNIPQNIKNRASEINSIILSLQDVKNTAIQADQDITSKYNKMVNTKKALEFNKAMKEIQNSITNGKLLNKGKYLTEETNTVPTLEKEIEKVTVGSNSELAICQSKPVNGNNTN
jgi:hypothetical protein